VAVEETNQQKKVDWAYEVITSVTRAMDKVAAKPRYYPIFSAELLKKMPDVIDALMILTKEEHYGMMARFLKASTGLTGEWLKTMGK